MEKGSEFRMQKASEMLGVPTSELGHMKITDLKDHRHPGDVAAKIAPPPLAAEMRQMAQNGAPVGFMNNGQIMGGMASEEVSSGFAPNMGINFIDQVVRPQHSRYAPSNENPALQTLQPGYRSRRWR